jgi:outer membrane protein assembly factor BamB
VAWLGRGLRVAWPIALAGVLLLVSAGNAGATGLDDWPQFHRNAPHTGWNRSESILTKSTVRNLVQRWAIPLGDIPASDPVEANGLVYFSTMDGIMALTPSSGAEVWNWPFPIKETGAVTTPAVVNGRLFDLAYPINRPRHPCRATLFALNASSGLELWARRAACTSAALTATRRVVIASGEQSVTAYGMIRGYRRWTFTTGDFVLDSPAVADRRVFAASNDGFLYALDATTGGLIWKEPMGGGSSSPAVAGGRVYVGSEDGHVYAFAADSGQPLWSYDVGVDVESSPAVANGIVYTTTISARLFALNAVDGSLLWRLGNARYFAWNSSPAVAHGVVYAYVFSHGVSALLALKATTGRRLWSAPLIAQPPAVAQGMVFVMTTTGPGSDQLTLYAFGLPVPRRVTRSPS